MTRRWMLQSQASLLWIRIPASHMNFNDSFVNFLDMHHLAPSACQVINQRPTLLIRSPVLTSALSHSMATGWRLSTRPMGPENDTRGEHPVAPSMARTSAQHMSAGSTNKERLVSNITEGTQGRRSIFDPSNPSSTPLPCSLLSLCTTSLFLCNFLWKHDITENTALSPNLRSWTILPEKEKWNLITSDYAV